jgi:hypothetical protein
LQIETAVSDSSYNKIDIYISAVIDRRYSFKELPVL